MRPAQSVHRLAAEPMNRPRFLRRHGGEALFAFHAGVSHEAPHLLVQTPELTERVDWRQGEMVQPSGPAHGQCELPPLLARSWLRNKAT